METAGIALGGFMGTGKSTVGALLAERLKLPFVDLDDVLHERFGPIPAQFASEGEGVFRAREHALVLELCDGARRVLATGGGVFASRANRLTLRRQYRLVTLRAPLDVLRQRVGSGEGRPNWAAAEALYEQRQDAYASVDLTLDATLSPHQLVEEVVTWLG